MNNRKMKREEFLKKIALGMGVATVTPIVLMAKNDPVENDKLSIAIDVETISHFTMRGVKRSASDILELWKETGILVYSSHHGNSPILFNGKVELVDVDG